MTLTELLPPKDDGLAPVVRIVAEVIAAQVVVATVLGGLVVTDSPVQGASCRRAWEMFQVAILVGVIEVGRSVATGHRA